MLRMNIGTGVVGAVALALDSTTSPATSIWSPGPDGINPNPISVHYAGRPGLGLHFLQAIEMSNAGTPTFYGDATGAARGGFTVWMVT